MSLCDFVVNIVLLQCRQLKVEHFTRAEKVRGNFFYPS